MKRSSWPPESPPATYLSYDASLPLFKPYVGGWTLVINGEPVNQPCPKAYMRNVVEYWNNRGRHFAVEHKGVKPPKRMDVNKLPVYIVLEYRWARNWKEVEEG